MFEMPNERMFAELRRRIEVAQRQLEGTENVLRTYYDTPAGERVRVGNLALHESGLLIISGRDMEGADCICYAGIGTMQLVTKVEPLPSDEPRERALIGFNR
jgi:hypothetical protein